MSKRNTSDAIFNTKRVAIVSVLGAVGLFAIISFGGETFLEGVVTNTSNGNTVPTPPPPPATPLTCTPGGVGPGVQPDCCGDGVTQTANAEQCDDGVANGPAGPCNGSCQPVCGDGVIYANEQCDEGAANDNEGTCTLACKSAVCGDGYVHAGVEECDLDAENNGDSLECTSQCKDAVCGDGLLYEGAEQCDDGNTVSGDGCSDICEVCAEDIAGLQQAVVDAQNAYDAANMEYEASRAEAEAAKASVLNLIPRVTAASAAIEAAKPALATALANARAAIAEALTAELNFTTANNATKAANVQLNLAIAAHDAANAATTAANNAYYANPTTALYNISHEKAAIGRAKEVLWRGWHTYAVSREAIARGLETIRNEKAAAMRTAQNAWQAKMANMASLRATYKSEYDAVAVENAAQLEILQRHVDLRAVANAAFNAIAAPQAALDAALAIPACTDESDLPPGETLAPLPIIGDPANIDPEVESTDEMLEDVEDTALPEPESVTEPGEDTIPGADAVPEEHSTGDTGETGDTGDGGFWPSFFSMGGDDGGEPENAAAPESCEWFEFWC